MAVLNILLFLMLLPFVPIQSTTTEPEHVVASTRGSNTSSSRCIPRERDALLAFAASLTVVTDPDNYLLSWKGEDCCQWEGIHCSNHTGHVMELALHNIGIQEGQMNSSLLGLRHLTSLDLSYNNFSGAPIPQFIGGFENLRHLDLSYSNFSGQVPPQLGNLSNLIYLDLRTFDGYSDNTYSTDLAWLSRLSELEKLDLSNMNLSTVIDWTHVVNKLPSLVSLQLSFCGLWNVVPSPEHMNLTSLEYLDLEGNEFSSSAIAKNLFWNLQSLRHIYMGYCGLQGSITEQLGNSTLITTLYLEENNLVGTIPRNFRTLHNLEELFLSGNNISGPVSVFLNRLSGISLRQLLLSDNNLTGRLPDQLGHLGKLDTLDLSSNKISGELPLGIGGLTELIELYLHGNDLDGTITESHLGKLTKLQYLRLSYNSLAIAFDDNWVPPFNLSLVGLQSCKIGSTFPKWLRSQNNILALDISNTSIVGPLPYWFWVTFLRTEYLILSSNKISGMLSSTMFSKMEARTMDFSDNLLIGSIPMFPKELQYLDLSKNNLSGSLPLEFGASQLRMLVLFQNSISGSIPFYICHWDELVLLDLSKNQLYGPFPNCEVQPRELSSHGKITIPSNIVILSLMDNNLSGEFPMFIRKCQFLIFLDLSYNQFSGILPTWIEDKLPSLAFLSLRSNFFSGHIPRQLVNMKGLRYLDLACNNLSGTIPWSLANLGAMVADPKDEITLRDIFDYGFDTGTNMIYYSDALKVVIKGQLLEFTRGIIYMVNFDLSCNILTGHIPDEIGKLAVLKNLNLSWNHLNGTIPDSIGGLRSMESLDLSYNEFGGEVPVELSNLLSLSHLNLSYNNLTGRIPSGNQLQTLIDPATIYIGNPGLCGPPLSKNCSEAYLTPTQEDHGSRDDEIFLFLAVGAGFVMGLWIILFLLIFNKNWRIRCFLFSDRLYEWVYVQVNLSLAFLTWKKG